MNDHDQETTTTAERFLAELRQEFDNLRADADAQTARAAAAAQRADEAELSARDLFRANLDLTNRIRDRAVIEQAKGVLVERLHIVNDRGGRKPMDQAAEFIRRRARSTNQTMDTVAAYIITHLTPAPHPGHLGRPKHHNCVICQGRVMDAGPVEEWRTWGVACTNHHLNVDLWETITLHGQILE